MAPRDFRTISKLEAAILQVEAPHLVLREAICASGSETPAITKFIEFSRHYVDFVKSKPGSNAP